MSGKRAWDGLCALLVDLGAPLEAPRPSSLNSSEHREYLDLLNRYSGRETHQVRDIFQETNIPGVLASMIAFILVSDWISQTQPAIFVLRFSKIDVEALDIELLMYHIFQVRSISLLIRTA